MRALRQAAKQTEQRCGQADGWGSGVHIRSATALKITVSGIKLRGAMQGPVVPGMVVLMRANALRSFMPLL